MANTSFEESYYQQPQWIINEKEQQYNESNDENESYEDDDESDGVNSASTHSGQTFYEQTWLKDEDFF